MRIDYEKYPILKTLTTGRLELDSYPKELFNDEDYKKSLTGLVSLCKSGELFYVTDSFLDKSLSDSFLDKWDLILPEINNDCGIFIYKKSVIFYNVYTEGKVTIFSFGLFSGNNLSLFGTYGINEGKITGNAFDVLKNETSSLRDFTLCLILFKQFAEIETKEIKPKERKILSHGDYSNLTSINVQILDCTWFTNLIRSEGFNVRGHFRLQPCGINRSGKKLIWINDFQKDGYSRTASKLK